MKYFSMFSGIGGFEKGIINAGLQWDCVGYSEIDVHASAIYNYNFKGQKNYGDATKIVPTDLPGFELLVGGFPCQSFSVAGKRRGFEDTRGTLFFEISRILADKRPGYILLENVPGLYSHENGKTFQTILGVLTDLNYDVQIVVLNSKYFGVPQNRVRIFFVGNLTDRRKPEVFYPRERKIQSNSKRRIGDIHTTACCLTTRGYAAWNGSYVKKNNKIRRLTEIEHERLQGFPDDWTKYGNYDGVIKEVSSTQRYKCLGNAVTTNVISYLAKIINKAIL